jgi:hypothetical protein
VSVALFFLVPAAVLLKSGFAGALTWACFALIPSLLAIDAVRTGVVATRGSRYHRERERRRYWAFLILFAAIALILWVVGVAVVVRDGVGAFVPVQRGVSGR